MKNLLAGFTKEQRIIGVCLICLGLAILVGTHYKNKANGLEITLATATTTLKIERKKAKLAGNLQERLELQDALAAITNDYLVLSKKYNTLLKAGTSYTETMEDIGELNNNEDICLAWAKLGYHICE